MLTRTARLLMPLILLALSGCATRSIHHSSSVVQYLYPDKAGHVDSPSIPVLALPLNVGIAFVPDTGGRHRYLTEDTRTRLLDEISAHFRQYDFVDEIQVIPSVYLKPGGSFTNLDQIRTMYGVDIMALVSYDQTQFTDEGLASFTYWTIVGAYIIPGEKNDTHTMLDTAVYDIASRKLLFRAPGTSHIKGHATPINLSEELRADSLQGFDLASRELITSLDSELERFREKVRQSPDRYRVEHRAGYTGAGRLDAVVPLLLVLLAGWRVRYARRSG